MLIFCYNCFWWLIFFKEVSWYIKAKDTPQTLSPNSPPPGSSLCWGQRVSSHVCLSRTVAEWWRTRKPGVLSPWVAKSQTWPSNWTAMVEILILNLKMLTQYWVKLREKSMSQWYLRETLDWTNIVERGTLQSQTTVLVITCFRKRTWLENINIPTTPGSKWRNCYDTGWAR